MTKYRFPITFDKILGSSKTWYWHPVDHLIKCHRDLFGTHKFHKLQSKNVCQKASKTGQKAIFLSDLIGFWESYLLPPFTFNDIFVDFEIIAVINQYVIISKVISIVLFAKTSAILSKRRKIEINKKISISDHSQSIIWCSSVRYQYYVDHLISYPQSQNIGHKSHHY